MYDVQIRRTSILHMLDRRSLLKLATAAFVDSRTEQTPKGNVVLCRNCQRGFQKAFRGKVFFASSRVKGMRSHFVQFSGQRSAKLRCFSSTRRQVSWVRSQARRTEARYDTQRIGHSGRNALGHDRTRVPV
jgi:hypothetical protein